MELKCKNCGQFLDENDLFCRYCGCPNTALEKKKEPKLNKKQIEDQAQEQKTIVSTDDMVQACEIDYSLVKVKRKGELFSLRMQSIIVSVIALLFSGGGLAMSIVLKGVEGNVLLRFLGIFLGIIIIFIGLVVAIERINLVTTYSNMQEKTITVPKYGLRKTPMFMLGGYIFTVDCECVCPNCQADSRAELLDKEQSYQDNAQIIDTTADDSGQQREVADNTRQLDGQESTADSMSVTVGVDNISSAKAKKERDKNKDVRVLGDLHVELIAKRAVAVCNYNRKHIYSLSSEQFFDYYLGKTQEMLNQTKLSQIKENAEIQQNKENVEDNSDKIQQ